MLKGVEEAEEYVLVLNCLPNTVTYWRNEQLASVELHVIHAQAHLFRV